MYLPGNEPESGLHEAFESSLLGEDLFPRPSSGRFRPSEASALITTKNGSQVLGHCARATWFRLKGYPSSEGKPLPHQIQRMEVGKEVEDSIIERCKIAGIYSGNNIQFQTTFNGVAIAGELDAVLRRRSDNVKYVAEIKSIYGYLPQKEIFGRFLHLGQEAGKPRDSYLMQIALYLMHFSKLPKDHPMYLPFGAIFVSDRGDGHYGVFDVWLEEEIRVLGEDETITVNQIKYRSSKMKVPTTIAPYTVEDIISRFQMIKVLLAGEVPPPRDFIREYDEETIERKHNDGEISDSSYKKWKSSHGPRGKGKESLGDWNCQSLYCPYSTACWEAFEK